MSSIKHFMAGILLAALGTAAQAGDVTVSAATSLTSAFQEIARAYEAAHQGSKVLLNFGASGALLQQLAKGAPVDVFASADQETMDQAASQQLLAEGTRVDFARNRLVLVVPADSRLQLQQLGDLQHPGIGRIAIGNPASVPAGRYAQRALQAAALWSPLQARLIDTQNVRQALDYVARGEVDAAFVYATDALLLPAKVRVALVVPLDEPIRYPLAQTAESGNAAGAQDFIEQVLSPAGQAVLARHGFLRP